MIGDIMQPTHLLFVLVIALLVLGPKRLPEVGRQLGNGIRDFRAAISGEHTEDEESTAEDDDVLAPVAGDPAVEPAVATPPAESHVADATPTHPDTPADHELAHSTAEQSTLSADHQLGGETAEPSPASAEHEFADEPVGQATVAAAHELPAEAVAPPPAPIEPAVAHTPPDSAAGDGAAAAADGNHSFATESSAPAENPSDRVA